MEGLARRNLIGVRVEPLEGSKLQQFDETLFKHVNFMQLKKFTEGLCKFGIKYANNLRNLWQQGV